MLTLTEVLSDVAASPAFSGVSEEGIGIGSRGSNGETPLHWMATLGDEKATQLLVGAGADVNATDSEGNTPLHEAVTSRQASLVKLLLELGANPAAKNQKGVTPLVLAMADGYSVHLALRGRVDATMGTWIRRKTRKTSKHL